MVAAREMGVPPWELAERPAMWMHLALEFSAAEEHARKMASKRRRQA